MNKEFKKYYSTLIAIVLMGMLFLSFDDSDTQPINEPALIIEDTLLQEEMDVTKTSATTSVDVSDINPSPPALDSFMGLEEESKELKAFEDLLL